MSRHDPSKRPILHTGHIEYLVDCSCGMFRARVVRLEEEADIDIEAHLLNVRQQVQRLAHIYQPDGVTDDQTSGAAGIPDRQL